MSSTSKSEKPRGFDDIRYAVKTGRRGVGLAKGPRS